VIPDFPGCRWSGLHRPALFHRFHYPERLISGKLTPHKSLRICLEEKEVEVQIKARKQELVFKHNNWTGLSTEKWKPVNLAREF